MSSLVMTVQDTRSSQEEQEKMEKEQDLEEGECSDEEEEQQQVVVPAPPTHKTKGSGQPRNCTRISSNMQLQSRRIGTQHSGPPFSSSFYFT
jgi:hypothetical protein